MAEGYGPMTYGRYPRHRTFDVSADQVPSGASPSSKLL